MPCVCLQRLVAELCPVRVTSKGKHQYDTTVAFLPMSRWVENLLLTPDYLDQIKSVKEQLSDNYKLLFPYYAHER